MIIHADSLPDGSVQGADVCIVGGGPVGIQLARRLARRGVRVMVVESGEEQPVPRAQDLNEGTVSGLWPGPLRDIRIRQLGGTMHVWGGNCRPLDALDFRRRDWVPNSGWPVTHAEMLPWMAEAHDALLLDAFGYAPEGPALSCSGGEESAFEEVLFKLSRLVCGTGAAYLGTFADYLSGEIRGDSNPKFVLGATVCQILLAEDRHSVEGLYALTLQGRELHLRARAYVFACGGIETARLLLASREDMACGVGNQGGSVGRYFMEHPHGLAGLLLVHEDRLPTVSPFSPGLQYPNSVVQRRLRLTDDAQARLRLLNMSFQLIATSMKPAENGNYESQFERLEREVENPQRWRRFYIAFLAEQAPNPDSRITLGMRTDFFGIPSPDLCWRVSHLEYQTVAVALNLLKETIFTGPYFQMEPCIAPEAKDWVIGYGAHHMGTTRMSLSARTGVVDRDCRIHGLGNGFCAGSSVFSTAGTSNPMLTSIALALRLADHLAGEIPSLPMPRLTGRMRRPAVYAAQEAG